MIDFAYLGKHIAYQRAYEALLSASGLSDDNDLLPSLVSNVTDATKTLQAQRDAISKVSEGQDFSVIPSVLIQGISAEANVDLAAEISKASADIGLPLQVRDDNFNSLHRHFPVRRPKNIQATAQYFQMQVLDEQGCVCIERLYNDYFSYAAIIVISEQGLRVESVFGLNDDHGVLQEVFQDKILLHSVIAEQIRAMARHSVACFDLENCAFSLYFNANSQQANFSHISLSVDLPCLLSLWQNVFSTDSNYVTACLVYQPVNRSQLFVQAVNNNEIPPLKTPLLYPAYYLSLTQSKTSQLDRPIGVTIAQETDVRQSLRQAIRYENVLAGKLVSY